VKTRLEAVPPLIIRISSLAGIDAGEKHGVSRALHAGYPFVNTPSSFALLASPAIDVRALDSRGNMTLKGNPHA
jgi:hypothetical protein